MICYAAHTTGARNRAALDAVGWGLLCSAAYRWTDPIWRARSQGGHGLALDNGAWSAHTAGRPFDEAAFVRAVEAHTSDSLDFVVCPDVVMDAAGTRSMIARWLAWTLARTSVVLLPVQDGMEGDNLPLSRRVGVFVGGSTEWKEASMEYWARRAHAAGAWCHVGRVNSVRRLRMARAAGVDSIDGSGPSRFATHLAVMEQGRRGAVQTSLCGLAWRAHG